MHEKIENRLLRNLKNIQIQEFILTRKISPEDFPIVEELLGFSKQLVIEHLHNTFGMLKERATPSLRKSAEITSDPQLKRLYSLAADFAEKYDWAVAWNLVVILERI